MQLAGIKSAIRDYNRSSGLQILATETSGVLHPNAYRQHGNNRLD
jgi:hypothetical protein